MAETLINLLSDAGADVRDWYDIVLVNSNGDDITLHYMFDTEETLFVEYHKKGETGKGIDFCPSEVPDWTSLFCTFCGLGPQDTDWFVSPETLEDIEYRQNLIKNLYARWKARLKGQNDDIQRTDDADPS